MATGEAAVALGISGVQEVFLTPRGRHRFSLRVPWVPFRCGSGRILKWFQNIEVI